MSSDILVKPSRKRQLLALYVDYPVFSAVYQPVAWALRSMAPLDNWFVALAVFLGLRVAAWALKLVMPGQWALGIHGGQVATVEPHILQRERWWTATVGTLLVLEGSKNVVRWTQGRRWSLFRRTAPSLRRGRARPRGGSRASP